MPKQDGGARERGPFRADQIRPGDRDVATRRWCPPVAYAVARGDMNTIAQHDAGDPIDGVIMT
jgi:hypothetical protein